MTDIYWIVQGIEEWFATKMDAEIAARKAFPDESPGSRYARIYYRMYNPYDPELNLYNLNNPVI